MVRQGHVLSAPHFVTAKRPGHQGRPQARRGLVGLRPGRARSTKSIGKPCRVANDADVQGLAVVQGKGFEAVITLGTGFGTAFFMDGSLMPHIEFSHLEFRKGETFNEQLGEAARKKIGDERWNKRVRKAIAYLDALTFFDHLYIGGGNGAAGQPARPRRRARAHHRGGQHGGHPRRHQALGRATTSASRGEPQ